MHLCETKNKGFDIYDWFCLKYSHTVTHLINSWQKHPIRIRSCALRFIPSSILLFDDWDEQNNISQYDKNLISDQLLIALSLFVMVTVIKSIRLNKVSFNNNNNSCHSNREFSLNKGHWIITPSMFYFNMYTHAHTHIQS